MEGDTLATSCTPSFSSIFSADSRVISVPSGRVANSSVILNKCSSIYIFGCHDAPTRLRKREYPSRDNCHSRCSTHRVPPWSVSCIRIHFDSLNVPPRVGLSYKWLWLQAAVSIRNEVNSSGDCTNAWGSQKVVFLCSWVSSVNWVTMPKVICCFPAKYSSTDSESKTVLCRRLFHIRHAHLTGVVTYLSERNFVPVFTVYKFDPTQSLFYFSDQRIWRAPKNV